MAPALISLTQLAPGQVGYLPSAPACGNSPPESGDIGDHADLLRAMGLRPNATVRLCRLGDPCVVLVGQTRGDSCRLGLSRKIAERISVCVSPMTAEAPARA